MPIIRKPEPEAQEPETLFKGLAALEKFLAPYETRWQLETLIDEAVQSGRMSGDEGEDAKNAMQCLKSVSLAKKLTGIVRLAWRSADEKYPSSSADIEAPTFPRLIGHIEGALCVFGDYPITFDTSKEEVGS